MKKNELFEEIDIEFESLHNVECHVDELLQLAGSRAPSAIEKTAAGAFLSQFYNGIENILKRFVKHLGDSMPAGDDWHIVLLNMFVDGSQSSMPVLFNNDQKKELSDFRKFRHVFRNSYAHELNWNRLKPGLEKMPGVLHGFEKRVRTALDALT